MYFTDDYGIPSAADTAPELPEELAASMKRLFSSLQDDDLSPAQGSEAWKELRRRRLTASNFGTISRRRATTGPQSLVVNLLYTKFNGNRATTYGIQEEGRTEVMLTEYMEGRGRVCCQ